MPTAGSDTDMELFVFPLAQAVLFPTAILPLNIFEPRYVRMVQDSLATGTPIAIAREHPSEHPSEPSGGPGRELIAGYGKPIPIKRKPDGTMVILLEARGKARIGRPIQEEPYLVCESEPIPPSEEVSEENRFALNRIRRTFSRWVEQNLPDPKQRDQVLASTVPPGKLLDCASLCLVRDPRIQQAILEFNDINERIRFMKYLV